MNFACGRFRVDLLSVIIFLALPVPLATAGDGALISANTAFAFDLFRQTAQAQPDHNIFISPFSVSTALQLVANGAAGETRTEMQRALKTSGIDVATLNGNFLALNRSLIYKTNAVLTLANGIWYQDDVRLKPAFVNDNQTFFHAGLGAVDFKKAAAADMINQWASKHTGGKIDGIVSFPFAPETGLILANAIYFKGRWKDPFDPASTEVHPFYLMNGMTNPVPMMSRHGQFFYADGKDFKVVRLPYAAEEFQMYLVLPAQGTSPVKMVGNWNDAAWRNQVLSQLRKKAGHVVLPKFKMEYKVRLNNPLQALGMKQAFEPAADFSAMTDEPLFIGEVDQKSYVDVDEQGTEAAAVTTVHMVGLAVLQQPEPPFDMILDHPFFFVITDAATGSVLFMGAVFNPVSQ